MIQPTWRLFVTTKPTPTFDQPFVCQFARFGKLYIRTPRLLKKLTVEIGFLRQSTQAVRLRLAQTKGRAHVRFSDQDAFRKIRCRGWRKLGNRACDGEGVRCQWSQGCHLLSFAREAGCGGSVIGTNVLTRAFDGVDEKAMKSFVADVGRIDYLVIAAGGGGITGPFNSLDLAEFRRAFERKFWVQVNAAKIGGPAVASEGSITFVTGIFGLKALRNNSGVSAVNGAINVMVGPLAIEFAPVRVNAVSPGLVDSPYWDRLQPDARERLFEQRARNHLTGRVGKPDEVADFVLHVALNTFLCGAVIPLDGGFLLADRS